MNICGPAVVTWCDSMGNLWVSDGLTVAVAAMKENVTPPGAQTEKTIELKEF